MRHTQLSASDGRAVNLKPSPRVESGHSHSSSSRRMLDVSEVQAAWRLPQMVEPEEEEEEENQQYVVDHGELNTDAILYVIKEKTSTDERFHSVLQMPSSIPDRLLDSSQDSRQPSSSYNVIMIDVSGSMSAYWNQLLVGWNCYVAPRLTGRTNLFVFGDSVVLKRSDSVLEMADFESGGTNLTGALQTIANEVYLCKEKYIKVFLLTDGHHNATQISPDMVIQQIFAPERKVCCVCVIGVGSGFPVQYSINIRSRLHNDSANFPPLFWVKRYEEIEVRMKEIGSTICDGASQVLHLSMAGFSLPGEKAKDTFHPKEWVYFPFGPEKVQELSLSYHRNICRILLQPRDMPVPILKEVFRQWNSVIIQLHNKKEVVPSDTLPFMERLFNTKMEELRDTKSGSIRERLAKREFKTYETDFRTLFNKIRAILTTVKFSSELELAENILSTTVGGGKYETKVLQMKGHTAEDYMNDCKDFMNVYEEHKHKILKINNIAEDCCRITLSSTVSDLQDPDFAMMMDLNKFEFLKHFTISGIPVYAPSRDSVSISPWSYGIHALVDSPYTIMSQVAIESFSDLNSEDEKKKEMQLQWGEQKTRCNAIVPVFPPKVAKIMAPIVHTRLYAMCASFAILKTPFIIDNNIHMAALGVTWVKILFEYPTTPRPEFVSHRIESIEATADLYLGRPSYMKYWQVLKSDPAQALMTESTIQVDNKTLKCETLIKPMFILHMYQRSENLDNATVVANIMRMILLEYVGRCLSRYKINKNHSTPFTDFFAKTLADQELKKEWVQKYMDTTRASIIGFEGFLLDDFYTLEEVQKAAKKTALEEIKCLKEQLTAQIPIAVDVTKVEQLRSVSLAGDVSWFTLKVFAREIGLREEVINDLFSERSVFMYTAHALQYRSSRERLTTSVGDYTAFFSVVTKNVQQENYRSIATDLISEIVNQLQSAWLKAYAHAHREVVQPMTRQQILAEAPERGVQVTDITFEEVYKKYRPDVGLLSNACQCRACPYFLIPNRRYNQHSSVERQSPTAFPHGLHRAAYHHRDSDLPTIISYLESGTFKTPVPRQAVEHFKNHLADLKEIYKETDSSAPT
ncbi:uncharacterized protein [Cherax quadricarinatus]|nr:uncharacterized protein LOC128684918 isoform X2 [Cherax quadricarinatus]